MKKKMFSIVCAAIVLLSGRNLYVSAEENETFSNNLDLSRRYLYTDSIESELGITASGSATGTSRVYGLNYSVTQITVHQYLQKKNGSNWEPVDQWSHTTYTWYNICDYPYTITSAGTYRIRTEANVYCGNNYETVSCNSSSVPYP